MAFRSLGCNMFMKRKEGKNSHEIGALGPNVPAWRRSGKTDDRKMYGRKMKFFPHLPVVCVRKGQVPVVLERIRMILSYRPFRLVVFYVLTTLRRSAMASRRSEIIVDTDKYQYL